MKIKLKVRKIFFPIYNGVRFFSALYVMSDICFTYYLFAFSVQDALFSRVFPCKFISPRNQSAGYFFWLEITHNPSKVNWSAAKIHQTSAQQTDSDLSITSKAFRNNRGQNSPGQWKNSFLLTSTRRDRTVTSKANFLGWMTNFSLLWVYARTDAPLLTGSSS